MESDLYYGCWGEYRLQYLKSEHPALYQEMKEQGTLDAHLQGIEETYEEKAERLSTQLQKEQGVTPSLKNKDLMAWLKKTNAIDAQVKEILRQEICQ